MQNSQSDGGNSAGRKSMTVKEIAQILDAQWLCGQEEGDRVVHYAFASDMMSDVLAYVQEDTVLLLTNSVSRLLHPIRRKRSTVRIPSLPLCVRHFPNGDRR